MTDPPGRGDCADGAVCASPILLNEKPEELLRCAYRHLAVAATQLAAGETIGPAEAERYAQAAARFRALTEQPWGVSNGLREAAPFVVTVAGASVSVADLFASACIRARVSPPPRSIDPALVDEAKDLLRGLSWQVLPLQNGLVRAHP